MTFPVTLAIWARDFVNHRDIRGLAGKVDTEKGYVTFDPKLLNESTITALDGVLKDYSFIKRGDGKQQSEAGKPHLPRTLGPRLVWQRHDRWARGGRAH
jgi:hypothetical protein